MKEEWEEERTELEPGKVKGVVIGLCFAVFLVIFLLAILQVAGVVEIFRGGVGTWGEW